VLDDYTMMTRPAPACALRRCYARNRSVVTVIAGLFAVVIAFLIRNVVDANASLRAGDAARDAGEREMAILHFRHGLESYTPFGDANAQSLKRLLSMGDAAMARGDVDLALFAYRSGRFGILATRHLTVPFESYLAPIHRRIRNAESKRGGLERRKGPRLEAYEARLPVRWKGFLGAALFLLWLGTFPVLIRFGFDAFGARTRLLPYIGAAAIAAFAGWCGLLAAL